MRTISTSEQFEKAIIDHLHYSQGTTIQSASQSDYYMALAHTVRDHLIDRWRATTNTHFAANPKFVYYLSAEYLLGKQLEQNLLYTGLWEIADRALATRGRHVGDALALDTEPGLGNGGLGRLAACFLDSLATLDIPAVGYGIRYEYGIFRQSFEDGWQVEAPDDWLHLGFPWDFAQPDDMVEVGFGGGTHIEPDGEGGFHVRWTPENTVKGEPAHLLVPGYGTHTVNMLRLWRARATTAFDFRVFDAGDYARAVQAKVESETITKVLYPNDNTPQGKWLRFTQQYFFVACSIHDIIRRWRFRNDDWNSFPEKVAIQLNDTHPVIGIPELMRVLVDEERLPWAQAWDITRRTFAYTCHTLLPEALEVWPVSLVQYVLPRHMEIIREIDRRFLEGVRARYPGDEGRVQRMSILAHNGEEQVRMAHLACVGCFSINGVAELHSRLLRERTLRDFAELWPEKFNNKTNGVTPRRFVRLANPELSQLITEKLGDGWLRDLEQLRGLEQHAEDPAFQDEWREVKRHNKFTLATVIREHAGTEVDPASIFDVMVKRLHEYKRQLLKALHIVTLYQRIKADPAREVYPRTFIFGAKAAPGYVMAKLHIKLINSIAEVVNHDPDVRGRLKVVFLENFNVSLAEKIYPAADISEQISLAGKEASGTGNMKFALNGAVTVGTLDGANVEIRELVGAENFFLFGLTADEVMQYKAAGYQPQRYYEGDAELRRALDAIAGGAFSRGDREVFRPILDSLLHGDQYMLLADYRPYIDCSERAADAYCDQAAWTRMSILNAARCGFFSSDRTIRQYCEEIWRVQPVPVADLGNVRER